MVTRARKRLRRLWLSIVAPTDPLKGAPDEVLWCTICVLSGIPTLLGAEPAALNALLPRPFLLGWAFVLVVCGGTIVVSSVYPAKNIINAAWRHRSASIMLGGAAIAYSIAVFAYAGSAGAFAGGLAFSFALARFLRAAQVHWWLRAHRVAR